MAKKIQTVEDKLRAIYTLQLIDSSIDKIRTIRGELPLEVRDLENEIVGLFPRTVADFHRELFNKLKKLNINVTIHNKPNELAEAIPFAENTINRSYHQESVQNFWQLGFYLNGLFVRYCRYLKPQS